MEKNKGFKNRVEKFFSSDDGQRILNFSYSFGAAIVIVGALFKIIHLPGADVMLCVGMGVEALIFALSAFDKPATNYHWERIFPVLQDENAKSADLAQSLQNLGNAANINAGQVAGNNMPSNAPITFGVNGTQAGEPVQNMNQGFASMPAGFDASSFNPAGFNGLSVNNTQLEKATGLYVEQLNSMVTQMERLKATTDSLTKVSETLLNSYSAITDHSGNISNISGNYIQQMDNLNKNIVGLNTIYEIQLKSVSSQLDTIDKVNSGLSNIRSLYENSSLDSYKIRQETEKMTLNLSQLNQVYERMLTAMTMNMNNPNNIR